MKSPRGSELGLCLNQNIINVLQQHRFGHGRHRSFKRQRILSPDDLQLQIFGQRLFNAQRFDPVRQLATLLNEVQLQLRFDVAGYENLRWKWTQSSIRRDDGR